jgi:hypothetical protein
VASLLVGGVLVALLIVFVSHNNGNGEAQISPAKAKQEYAQDTILVHQEQAPHTVRVSSPAAIRGTLVHAVHALMVRQVNDAILPGPVQRVRCWENARAGAEIAFHCSAEAADIGYPFIAVYRRGASRAVYCKKVYAPLASENIPVSPRCRLSAAG